MKEKQVAPWLVIVAAWVALAHMPFWAWWAAIPVAALVAVWATEWRIGAPFQQ